MIFLCLLQVNYNVIITLCIVKALRKKIYIVFFIHVLFEDLKTAKVKMILKES